MSEKFYCCDFCGRDTKSRSRICRKCTGGRHRDMADPGSTMDPWDLWFDELEHDYSENSLGPKQAEERMGSQRIDIPEE